MNETEFSQQRLQTALSPRPVRFYAQVESSSDIALDWLRNGAAAGSVVVADEQTRGRGRLGRSWYAPPATALMLSVVLRPSAAALVQVSMMGALVVCETLEAFGIRNVGIKWPNDTQIDGRKVCGVLPEVLWDGDRLFGAVLGIGLNVRIDFAGTPFEQTATSVETVLGKSIDRLELLTTLLERIDDWTARIESYALFDAWTERLTTIGQQVSVNQANGVVTGMAEGVDEHGALLVRDEDGALQRVIAGDIALGSSNGD
ncbi:MAG: biotin--[acetyl-CoA-carboxylase] ligase [Burkholderiales bacterium]|nr:biotin--[acetyl-CoA-carboxylase] ligase [Anaerolineae bacterium]